MSQKKGGNTRLFLGLILIVIGAAYSLDQMGYLEADRLWDYSPIVLIAVGLGKLVFPGSSSGRFIGFLIALIGTWLLADNLGWVEDFSIWDWWPVLLVILGLRLITTRGGGPARSDGSTVNALAMLGGASRVNSSADFRGGDLVAFMGGCEVDLRPARISSGPAVIDAFAFWGGVEIRVPRDWEVVVKGIPLLGGFEDATHPESEDSEDTGAQQLVVKGFAIMGGVEVKN